MGKKFAGKANVKTKKKPEKGFIILAAGVIVCILGLIAAIWWSVSRRSVGCLEISVNEEGDLFTVNAAKYATVIMRQHFIFPRKTALSIVLT